MSVIVFHEGAGKYGLLTSMMAIGSVTGALLAARRAKPTRAVLVAGAAVFGGGLALAAFVPTYALFAVVLVVIGAAAQTFTTSTNSTVQLATEPAMRGRVMAILLAIALGGTPIGAPHRRSRRRRVRPALGARRRRGRRNPRGARRRPLSRTTKRRDPMIWQHEIAYFFGGAFFANAVPHAVAGAMGRAFQSPFAKPPGEGLSSSVVNAAWGWLNLVVAWVLLARVGAFDLRNLEHAGAAGLAACLVSLGSARRFGRFNGGREPLKGN